jgi:hypothetical protein
VRREREAEPVEMAAAPPERSEAETSEAAAASEPVGPPVLETAPAAEPHAAPAEAGLPPAVTEAVEAPSTVPPGEYSSWAEREAPAPQEGERLAATASAEPPPVEPPPAAPPPAALETTTETDAESERHEEQGELATAGPGAAERPATARQGWWSRWVR